MTDRRSPLDATHRALDAKMVPFGGWEMPLSYPEGTLAEHRACRHGAVVFDVSHLGTVRVAGPGALLTLQRALTNDLTRIDPGRAQYTHLLDAHDASVVDDIIVFWVGPETFDVMPNASNTEGVTRALAEEAAALGAEVTATDVTAERAVLAVQGPKARERLAQVVPAAARVRRFAVASVEWEGIDLTVAGTGYTGEDGLEIAVPALDAGGLFDALVAAGIEPAGLGARDTLRLEAGLPLHGHELGPGITPLQANLGWVVAWEKGPFRGRDPLEVERDAGPGRRLRGLATEGRRPPREGQPVLRGGETVGAVTSGNFSPVLGHGIALAFLPPETVEGDELAIDVRGTAVAARVVPLPFVDSRASKGASAL
ncbi:glycine cleavage system aminomethyltransferase GcvT [Rhabdothermincola salaria]|uniref:glycine cleavage system aminomethyltransferase GcvT n=1 Tax=Rhabdothermincola salaria TaxID=2903142 RepID=UPI001E35A3A3|nr:glycine cleavage system aminomethyltransferase GcvT [Rhabdothermincola salaria]